MKAVFGMMGILFLLVLGSMVYADVSLVDPVVQKAKPNGVLDAGSISPGEKVELIFSRNTGYGRDVLWNQAQLQVKGNGPGIQTTHSGIETDSLITSIQTSPLTPRGEYTFTLRLIGEVGELQDETFTVLLRVENELVKGSLSTEKKEGRVNQPIEFSVLLVNDSSASIPILVEPALPSVWAQPHTITLRPHSFATVPIIVTPRFAGPKTFDIKLIRMDNGSTVETLNATLIANPTMKDRYSAGLYGFPFFTISLVAHYLANSFFSFLL